MRKGSIASIIVDAMSANTRKIERSEDDNNGMAAPVNSSTRQVGSLVPHPHRESDAHKKRA